jgi:small basic protein
VVLDSELETNMVNKLDLDKLERKNYIKHKYGKEIFVIERFIINVLWKGIISYLWVHMGARLNVGEKSIILRSVTFQNLVHNSYNARHVTHL